MKNKIYFIFLLFIIILLPLVGKCKTVADDVYVISSQLEPNKVLDINRGSFNNCSNIQLYDRNFSSAQKWVLEKNDSTYYTISSYGNSKYVLDVSGGNFKNGANVQLYKRNNTNAQKWIVEKDSQDNYTIFSYNKKYALDITGGLKNNGTNIQIYTANNTLAQKYYLEKIENTQKTIDQGIYEITSAVNNSLSLDVTNSIIDNGTNIRVHNLNHADNQKWEIIYDKDGYYKILSYLATNKVLDVKNGSKGLQTNLQLYEDNESDAQRWIIKHNSDNTYSFISKTNGLYIDVSGGSTLSGANVWLYKNNGSNAQKWYIKKIDNPGSQSISNGYYFINTKLDLNKSIDIKHGVIEPQRNVQIYQSNSTAVQKWYIEYKENGYYQIHSKKDQDYVLTYNETDNNVYIDNNQQNDNQFWIIRQAETGYYSLIAKNNKYLDVSGGNSVNETNIQIYDSNISNSQKFKLIPTSSEYTQKLEQDGLYYIESAENEEYVFHLSNCM